ncbi:MAG: YceI family protein [Xanthomonadales bacterium]|nr:YceI family protein [Xanthomonadales bacterium]
MALSGAPALLPVALVLLIGAARPLAASDTILLDGRNSHAEFSVKVLWMFDVAGQFGGVHGHVLVDRARNEAIVDARIDANDVHMRRAGAEDWVKSAEFFDVARHPEIRFLSAPFPLARLAEGGDLPGSLSVRGIRGPVVFNVRPSRCARAGFDCAVEATGSLRRGMFGMRSRKGTLADKVELSLDIRVESPVVPAAGG